MLQIRLSIDTVAWPPKATGRNSGLVSHNAKRLRQVIPHSRIANVSPQTSDLIMLTNYCIVAYQPQKNATLCVIRVSSILPVSRAAHDGR